MHHHWTFELFSVVFLPPSREENSWKCIISEQRFKLKGKFGNIHSTFLRNWKVQMLTGKIGFSFHWNNATGIPEQIPSRNNKFLTRLNPWKFTTQTKNSFESKEKLSLIILTSKFSSPNNVFLLIIERKRKKNVFLLSRLLIIYIITFLSEKCFFLIVMPWQ